MNIQKEILKASKIIEKLPVTIQSQAFEIMMKELINIDEYKSGSNITKKNEFTDIAEVDNDGILYFTVKDLKAKNATDAIRRIVYVLVRSATELLKVDTVSRKELVNPTLESWGLYNGNARSFLHNDKGIIKKGDRIKLSTPAKTQAERFIKQIQDPKYIGSWNRTY